MSNIYFFRGKAATGKTTISNSLSSKINVPILRKDVIFDELSQCIEDNALNNSITYSLLSKLIQTNINNGTDIIVDIGLSDIGGWNIFRARLDLKHYNVITFLCDCSNLDIWKARFEERLKNPTPNQYFKSADEIIAYYGKRDIQLLEDEYYIDSANSLESILEYVFNIINR